MMMMMMMKEQEPPPLHYSNEWGRSKFGYPTKKKKQLKILSTSESLKKKRIKIWQQLSKSPGLNLTHPWCCGRTLRELSITERLQTSLNWSNDVRVSHTEYNSNHLELLLFKGESRRYWIMRCTWFFTRCFWILSIRLLLNWGCIIPDFYTLQKESCVFYVATT